MARTKGLSATRNGQRPSNQKNEESDVEARLYRSVWGPYTETYQLKQARLWRETVAKILEPTARRRAA